MSVQVNTLEFEGKVVAKGQPIKLQSEMRKNYLYAVGKFIYRGAEADQYIQFVCYSWANGSSKFDDIFPGDVVKFNFVITGREYDPEKKDSKGAVRIWNENVVVSKVEILDMSDRKLYNEGLFDQEKPAEEDEFNDLPF